MNSVKENFRTKKSPYNYVLYRLAQFVALLLSFKISKVAVLTLALYVSTFFLFNREESLRNFVFDFKVNGIIICTLLSILAGGLINQFYDREKDRVTKPFRYKVQSFLKQKYYLSAYIALNLLSLGVAWLISPRVLVYLMFYQFILWFYSHKLSKLLFINNLTFVALSLYPFFGMLVYYKTFSVYVFFMAIFLFLLLLLMDILKDSLTKNADRIFGYITIPNHFGNKVTKVVFTILLMILFFVVVILIQMKGLHFVFDYYYVSSLFLFPLLISLVWSPLKNNYFVVLNILRLWVFIGVLSMLADGILTKLHYL